MNEPLRTIWVRVWTGDERLVRGLSKEPLYSVNFAVERRRAATSEQQAAAHSISQLKGKIFTSGKSHIRGFGKVHNWLRTSGGKNWADVKMVMENGRMPFPFWETALATVLRLTKQSPLHKISA